MYYSRLRDSTLLHTPPRGQRPSLNSKRILIIEDDIATRDALTECLRDHGYQVTCASDGFEALDLLQTMPRPDLILLDLMLPQMDGWDFRATQKRDPALSGIPVVALSAVGWLVDVDASLRKPVRVEELLETVDRLCGSPVAGSSNPDEQ
jgi:CheY-like chemotaxis protein